MPHTCSDEFNELVVLVHDEHDAKDILFKDQVSYEKLKIELQVGGGSVIQTYEQWIEHCIKMYNKRDKNLVLLKRPGGWKERFAEILKDAFEDKIFMTDNYEILKNFEFLGHCESIVSSEYHRSYSSVFRHFEHILVFLPSVKMVLMMLVAEVNKSKNLYLQINQALYSLPCAAKRYIEIHHKYLREGKLTLMTSVVIPEMSCADIDTLNISQNTRDKGKACCKTCKETHILGQDQLMDKQEFLKWWKSVIEEKEVYKREQEAETYQEELITQILGFMDTRNLRTGDKVGLSRHILLTELQKNVISDESLKMIIRGAYGSGKSIVLQLRLMKLIKEIASDDIIFFLTYNKKSLLLQQMKSLADLLRKEGIKLYAMDFNELSNFFNIPGITLRQFVEKISENPGYHAIIDEFKPIDLSQDDIAKINHLLVSPNLINSCVWIAMVPVSRERKFGNKLLFSDKEMNPFANAREVFLDKTFRCSKEIYRLVETAVEVIESSPTKYCGVITKSDRNEVIQSDETVPPERDDENDELESTDMETEETEMMPKTPKTIMPSGGSSVSSESTTLNNTLGDVAQESDKKKPVKEKLRTGEDRVEPKSDQKQNKNEIMHIPVSANEAAEFDIVEKKSLTFKGDPFDKIMKEASGEKKDKDVVSLDTSFSFLRSSDCDISMTKPVLITPFPDNYGIHKVSNDKIRTDEFFRVSMALTMADFRHESVAIICTNIREYHICLGALELTSKLEGGKNQHEVVSYLPTLQEEKYGKNSQKNVIYEKISEASNSILLTDIDGITGLEYRKVILPLTPSEEFLSYTLVRSVTRCQSELVLVQFPWQGEADNPITAEVIRAWKEKDVVDMKVLEIERSCSCRTSDLELPYHVRTEDIAGADVWHACPHQSIEDIAEKILERVNNEMHISSDAEYIRLRSERLVEDFIAQSSEGGVEAETYTSEIANENVGLANNRMGIPINTYMGMDAHEIAAKERAEKFVGRTELRQQVYEHCASENVENNTMVVNGWMGNGKTSLMAHVATKCINDLRPEGDFVFVHLVDSCAGSSALSNMLRRLHEYLSMYVGKENLMQTTTDLRTLHVAHLEEVAMKNPDKKFVIFVDAVNQFYNRMHSHSMWWLPSRKAPKNLRFIISTLWDTGDTYENALKRCPKAVTVEVPRMLKDDCEEMVLAMAKHHDIEITTENNDTRVGNQMEKLLNKNHSPLYLKTAVEGMRTKWIMADEVDLSEAHTMYIENLPLTIEELFEKNLDSWAGDFGWELIRWVMTIIALSRDGLKESMLTDLLTYVEEQYHQISFKHSLKTVLDFIRGFISCESEDNIRFFHEILPQVVLEKYCKRNYEPEVRDILVQFFLKHIKARQSEKYFKETSYYDDCLTEVIFHQTSIRMFAQDWNRTIPQVTTYEDTLKNILFIKERILWNQEEELLSDSRDTSKINMVEDERASICEWERFTRFYWPYIKEFPEWSYAFALNQPNNSFVAIETKALLEHNVAPDVNKTFPLTWLNKPDESWGNDKSLRCVQETTFCCDAGSSDQNICAFGADGKAFLNNLVTGDVVHQLKISGCATVVHLSSNCEVLWIGNNYGIISVWDVRTGEREHEDLKVGTNDVLMIEHVNEVTVVCGTGNKLGPDRVGTIAIVDTATHKTVRAWSTKLLCSSYCYHTGGNCILSGHDGNLIVWDISGNELKRFKIGGYAIRDICAYKELPSILLAVEKPFAGEIKTLNLITGECNTIALETGPLIAQYDHTGKSIICTAINGKTITIYNTAGTLLDTIRIHGGRVNDISPLPQLNSFISSANDGGKICIRSPPFVEADMRKVVIWCELLLSRKEFVILHEDGELKLYDASSLELRASVMVNFETPGSRATVHPSGKFMVLCTLRKICVVDAFECEILHVSKTPNSGEDCTIICAQFCPQGDKCIVATRMHGTHVYIVSDMHTFEHHLTYTSMKDGMLWCDVIDRTCVSCGDGGIVLWDIDTGKTLQVLRVNPCNYVKVVLDEPKRVIYRIQKRDADDKKHGLYLMDLRGRDLMHFNTNGDNMNPVIHVFSQKYLITAESDGTFRLHDLQTGEVLYVFVDENSLAFNAFLENPVTKTIHCYNQNGQCYTFEQTLM